MNDIPLWAQLASSILGSSVVAGIVGAISSSRVSRQKFKELDVLYRQKLEDIFIVNARSQVETLYIPLNASLTKLKAHYHSFLDKASIFEPEDKMYRSSEGEFQDACKVYIKEVTDLRNEGKDVYLTTELDKTLNTFTSFIRTSLITKEVIYWRDTLSLAESTSFTLITAFFVPFLSRKKRLEIEREVKQAIAAPVSTLAFKTRFLENMDQLKSLIREVTLGIREDSTK